MFKKFYKKYAILILIIMIFALAFAITARAAFAKGYNSGVREIELKYEIERENEAKAEELRQVANAAETPKFNAEAQAVARVLYGLSDYQLSDTAKMAVIEVIMSRAKCSYGEFGDDILSVCDKDGQWQGYVKDGPYIQSDYELADQVLNDISRARVTPDGCLYAAVSRGSVSVRKEWDSKNIWTVY